MLLELENVSKTFSRSDHSVCAVDGLSLQMERGQFVALCGPSGCGKSTLLMICGGLLQPDTGTVTVVGHNLVSLSAEKRADVRAAQIGYVFQQFHLVPYLTVLDNVLAACLGLRSQSDADPSGVETRALELVERFGLMDRVHHLPAELSTGERQRVALARASLNRPKVLLADEPTGNLDADNSEVVLDHLQKFAISGGSVLLVTHDMTAASRADRVIHMEAGRVVEPTAAEGGV